jgi:LacI family transcriptional regulator
MTHGKEPGNGRVSIRDVAARAGVSVGTVSNVLNRSTLVADSTRERVQEAIDALGFVRNESARQLRAGKSRMIGLIVLDISNPFFTDVARGVEDAASTAGVSVVLCNSDDDPAKEARYLGLLAEQRVQGVLIVPAGAKATRFAGLSDRGIPMVLLDRKATGTAVCSVSVDDIGGGFMAMSHLLEQGHRRVAFVGGGETRQVVERYQGACQALEAQGMSPAELVRFGTQALNTTGGRETGREMAAMPAGTRPTGVLCANDLLALGLIQEVGAAGLRVGIDIAVVGYDDIDFAAVSAVPLSSVRQPRHALGYTAASLLLEEASDSTHRHQQVVFVPELVVRASSERPSPDRIVSKPQVRGV